MAESDYQPTPEELLNRVDDAIRQIARQQQESAYLRNELADIRQEVVRLVLEQTVKEIRFEP